MTLRSVLSAGTQQSVDYQRSALLELFVYTHTHTHACTDTYTHVCAHTDMHKAAVIQTQMMMEKESSNPNCDSKEETEQVDPLIVWNEEIQMKLFSWPLSRRM